MNTEITYQKLKSETLQNFWGYSEFRDRQESVIDSVISGKDTLVLFPTGGGKSLCYQLPAIILEGTCLVISPLLALMKDQVADLRNRGIEAEYLSSEMDNSEAENIYSRCKDGITKILYVSPERLNNTQFLQNIEDIQISFIAVDEAHCISEWGQDFRPSYQNIKTFRKEFKNVPCIALTATATPKVLDEIKEKLELQNPNIFQKSFNRKNIRIITDEISDKYTAILDFLRFNPTSGIIYARTRKETEELAHFLKKQNIPNADFYHAGLTGKEKNAKQKKWLAGNSEVLISTNAFGMGIDKENVRFVIHLSPPASIENYFQEIGRAGRDSEDSIAILYWNKFEMQNLDEILKHQIPDKQEFLKIITYLYSIFQIADFDTSEKFHQFDIQRIKTLTKISLPKIKNVLTFLHNQEIIYYNVGKSLSSLELKFPYEEYESLPKKDAYFIELLMRNLENLTSKKIYFSEQKLAEKLGVDAFLLKTRIRELMQQNLLEYIDGAFASIKFTAPRNDRSFEGHRWKLFFQIQKNKIRKWEEMKYYIGENSVCKMRMILAYFGEKNTSNCGHCNVCIEKKSGFFNSDLPLEILQILKQKPCILEELFVKLPFHKKEKIRENIILLLDSGKVKMLDFKTYSV
ncbi:MAG: RecQ family ATP-dependent DNA helicase [Flavobacteriaceae bacterium]|nr:RecQ family ATP-dependent DNA helicase [Flavobacteriaceae bacterium]